MTTLFDNPHCVHVAINYSNDEIGKAACSGLPFRWGLGTACIVYLYSVAFHSFLKGELITNFCGECLKVPEVALYMLSYQGSHNA